jgi:hypothetical protein
MNQQIDIELPKIIIDYIDFFSIISEFNSSELSIPDFCNTIFYVYLIERLTPQQSKICQEFMKIPEEITQKSLSEKWWKRNEIPEPTVNFKETIITNDECVPYLCI